MRILFQPAKNQISPALYGISDLFPSLMTIVNQEMNCYVEGTPISIVAIDTVEHTIQVNWIPDNMPIPVTEPIAGKEWVLAIPKGIYGKDFEYVIITGGNRETKVLNYATNINSTTTLFIVGARLIYYNQFNNGWTLNTKIPDLAGSYWSQMNGIGGVWKHSDGTFRMAVNGYNSFNWQVGLFSSPDLNSWTHVSTAAKITFNPADWRMDGIHVSGIIKHPTEDKFFGICYGQSSAGYFRVGWVKFDENMENIEYSPNEILDTTGTYSGIYMPSIIFYNGKYRVYACKRNSNNLGFWTMCEYSADVPEGPYTFERISIESSSDDIQLTKTVYRSYSTSLFPFIVNSELFALVDGTANYDESGNCGNRQFGLFKYNPNTCVWQDQRNGLVLSNFYFGAAVYGVENSISGHDGGSPILFFNDGEAHFFNAATTITDDYNSFTLKKRLYYPSIVKPAKGTVNTIAPSITGNIINISNSTLKVNLMSVWEFNEASGTTANDSHGAKNYNHNMTINQAGKIGLAYRSTGTGFISGGTSDFNFAANQDFSVSMWVKLSVWDFAPYLIHKKTNGGDGKGFGIYYESRAGFFDNNGISRNNSLMFTLDIGATTYQLCTGPNSVPNANTNWHHIVIYRRGSTMGIVLNGGAANEFTAAGIESDLTNVTSFTFFRAPGGTVLNAYLDQSAVWSKALTPTEIAALYNSGNGRAYSEW